MKVQGRRKRGIPKRIWLDKVKDDIKEKGLSADEVYDPATCSSTPDKSGNKMQEKKRRRLPCIFVLTNVEQSIALCGKLYDCNRNVNQNVLD